MGRYQLPVSISMCLMVHVEEADDSGWLELSHYY